MQTFVEILVEHMDWLGYPVKDKVTGFSGVVECVTYDLYGCVLASVRAPSDKSDKENVSKSAWFDPVRLERTSKKRVMEPVVPRSIAEAKTPPGPAQKPAR